MNLDEFVKSGCAVLVVDDLPSARRAVSKLLEKLDLHKIVEASDGKQALDLLEREFIGLVITDWNMPGMSGLELIQELRSREKLSSIPYILISSHAERESVEEAAHHGVFDYMVKPFTLESLRKVFETAISRSKKSAQSSD